MSDLTAMTDSTTVYDETLADQLCDRVAMGGMLATICATEEMPSLDELKQWLRENTEFAGNLDRAIRVRRDVFFDDMKEVTDQLLRGEIDVADAEKEIERLKTLIEYSDMPVGIW